MKWNDGQIEVGSIHCKEIFYMQDKNELCLYKKFTNLKRTAVSKYTPNYT